MSLTDKNLEKVPTCFNLRDRHFTDVPAKWEGSGGESEEVAAVQR